MANAVFTINHAGRQVTMQDGGRSGLMRYGVPASGPMDRSAFAIVNQALGNLAGTPAIEVSLGGLALHCTQGPVIVGVAGGNFQVLIDQDAVSAWGVFTLHKGQTLTIRQGRWGRWCYVGFGGKLQARPWLGSVSTHGPTGLGAGQLITGGTLAVDETRYAADHRSSIIRPASARPKHAIRVVLGPQDRFFRLETIADFASAQFKLTDAYDRMGVRLSGPLLPPRIALDLPSQAIVRGSIQVAGDGVATVLLSDHQTTGGYPKIATVVKDDIDSFVQLRSHSAIRFHVVSPEAAIAAARTREHSRKAYFATLMNAR